MELDHAYLPNKARPVAGCMRAKTVQSVLPQREVTARPARVSWESPLSVDGEPALGLDLAAFVRHRDESLLAKPGILGLRAWPAWPVQLDRRQRGGNHAGRCGFNCS